MWFHPFLPSVQDKYMYRKGVYLLCALYPLRVFGGKWTCLKVQRIYYCNLTRQTCSSYSSTNYILKLKLSHNTPWRRSGQTRYSSYLFSTSVLDGGKWSASRTDRVLAPGKEHPVPIRQESGWDPEPVWTQRLEENSFRLCRGSALHRPVVHPVARHYTDWATRLTTNTSHMH
jgi:hypothetical protein